MNRLEEEGRFELLGLPPGAWKTRARPRFLPLEWVEGEVLLPASGRLENVDVALPARRDE